MLLCCAAAADYGQAAEDQGCGEDLLPCEGVHANGDADCDCDDRLDVAVHADDGRSDAFLRDRNQIVGDECRTDDQIGEFGVLLGRDACPVNVDKASE